MPLPPRYRSVVDNPDLDRPSKTQRKKDSQALQDLGNALVELAPSRLAQLDLPDVLVDAIRDAQSFTKWEARRRQMQYIGRLMRDIDPAPIQAKLEEWASGPRQETAHFHALEALRERLLADPAALDELVAEHPGLDRNRWRTLLAKARDEHAQGRPPRAYREIFRELRALFAADTGDDSDGNAEGEQR